VSKKAKKKIKAKASAARQVLRRKPTRRKARPFRQYAAIPVRVVDGGRVEVMLMTSRGTGRWVIPKGWPMRRRAPATTACREAYEEAGITGHLWSRRSVGTYSYEKVDDKFSGEVTVRVFVLEVKEQLKDWPERGQRRRRWFDPRRAATLVRERELSRLLRALPGILQGRKSIAAIGR
jgi:8-oxo-dGTP pyrophosphatase MutT (NUDIX family)